MKRTKSKSNKVGVTVVHNKTSLFNMKSDVRQRTDSLPASTYKPKFIYTWIPFPKLTPAEKVERERTRPCEEFQIFAFDVFTWGVEDAVGYWRSMTTKPLPVHPGDCKECRTLNRGFAFMGVLDKKVDDALKRAAEVVRTLGSKKESK